MSEPNKMTALDALKVLEDATAQVSANRQTHSMIIAALIRLKEEVSKGECVAKPKK